MIFNFDIIEKALWSGFVGFGFAILFNVPLRLLAWIFVLSLVAGFVKFLSLASGIGIINSSLLASIVVGFSSIPISRYTHTSPFVISIPSIIGMIPGYFGYVTLLGIMKIALLKNSPDDLQTLLSIMHNGLNMIFVLGALSIGVSLPWLIFREKGLKRIKLTGDENIV
jgi:uncharacterized membrane protein YjjB (DUF3815 family)